MSLELPWQYEVCVLHNKDILPCLIVDISCEWNASIKRLTYSLQNKRPSKERNTRLFVQRLVSQTPNKHPSVCLVSIFNLNRLKNHKHETNCRS